MKKRLLFIVLLAPLCTFAASENFVYFKNTGNLAFANPDSYSVSAVNDDNVSVTSGQNFNQQIDTDPTGGNYIQFNANRKGSSQAVTWVENQLSLAGINWTSSNMTSSINGSTPPANLNFALKVNLGFRYNNKRYICNNVILGQGHTGNNNNWWIFANTDSSKYPAQSVISGAIILDCVDQTDDYEQPLYIKAEDNSSFKVAGIVTSQVPTKQVTANQLCFQGLQLESFTNSQIDVTSGQLYSNVINVDSSSNCLTVYANRKKSSSVKDWAQDEMEQVSVWNKYNMASNPSAGLDRVPSELNFAIHGDLAFIYGDDHYICSNLTFGQGSGSGANNWWLFSNMNSNGKLSVGDVVISCTDTSTKRSSQTTLTMTPISDDLFQL